MDTACETALPLKVLMACLLRVPEEVGWCRSWLSKEFHQSSLLQWLSVPTGRVPASNKVTTPRPIQGARDHSEKRNIDMNSANSLTALDWYISYIIFLLKRRQKYCYSFNLWKMEIIFLWWVTLVTKKGITHTSTKNSADDQYSAYLHKHYQQVPPEGETTQGRRARKPRTEFFFSVNILELDCI